MTATAVRVRALGAPLVVGAVGIAAVALLRVRDPHDSGAYGLCPSRYLFGIDCPGCGGLRAVNDLTHLDLAAALSSNVLVVALAAVLPVFYGVWVVRRARGERDARMIVLAPPVGAALIVVLVVFTVVRNTPWGGWLAP